MDKHDVDVASRVGEFILNDAWRVAAPAPLVKLDLTADVGVVVEDLATLVAHGIPVRDKGPRVDGVLACAREGVVVNFGLGREGGGVCLGVLGRGVHLGRSGCLGGGGRLGRDGGGLRLLASRRLRLVDLTVGFAHPFRREGTAANAWQVPGHTVQ